jgi:hypothetical protein
MRITFTLLLSLLISYSCKVKDDGKINRDKFIAEYRQPFLNSDLTLFDYNPRVKFENYTDSLQYRFFIRQDNKLLISLWSDRKQIDTTDKIQDLIANHLDFISINRDSIRNTGTFNNIWLSKDSDNNIVLVGDSNKVFPIPNNTFHFDPISYFSNLDSLVRFYGIIAIKKHPAYTKLVFDSDKSLLYFPNVLRTDTIGMNLKKIDEKWYISNDKMNLDY